MYSKNKLVIFLIIIIVILSGIIIYKSNYEPKDEITLKSGSQVDLVMFMGQSNMSGTGDSDEAPEVISGAGFEFKAVTDPTKLYHLKEPFGEFENRKDGIDDGDLKTGSLVSSFVNSYYSVTKVPIVAVSASAGGSTLHSWNKEGEMLPDAKERYKSAKNWLNDNGYTVRHSYMVWLQGESDGNKGTTKEDYKEALEEIVSVMKEEGVEKCFIIRIGVRTEEPGLYDTIIEAQTELCQNNEDFILISTKAVELENMGLMRDEVHYTQGGLNIIGADAGSNMGYYVVTGDEPALYDSNEEDLYSDEEQQ